MNNKKYICTYFDYNYLPRGLALYYSVKRFHKIFDFYVLTFDKQTYEYLSNLNEEKLKIISIDQYDAYFKTSISKFEDKKQFNKEYIINKYKIYEALSLHFLYQNILHKTEYYKNTSKDKEKFEDLKLMLKNFREKIL